MAKKNKTNLQKRVEAINKGNALPNPDIEDNGNSVGPKTIYNEFVVVRVEQLAEKGLNNKQICQSLGIGVRTFYEWLEKYPQLAHALKKYRGLADIEVENALYRNAVGYTYKEQAITNRGAVVTVNKYHAGNATSQIFYLKNRMPLRYRDRIEHELSLSDDISQMAFAIKRREE